MTATVVVALLVATGEARAPATAALMAAAAEALGGSVVIQVEESPSLDDADALRVERTRAARAVVTLSWRGGANARAVLRLHLARADRWLERVVPFSAADTPVERGRALGFTIASMVPEDDPELRAAPRAPTPAPSIAREGESGAPVAVAPAPADDGQPVTRSIGLMAAGSTGVAGPASGLGGFADGEWFATDRLSLRAGAGVRQGSVAGFDGRALLASVAAGAAWWALPPSLLAEQPWSVGVRLDALALYQALQRQPAGGGAQWRGRLLPGADLLLTAGRRIGPGWELVAAAGPELAFGSTAVYVDPVRVNTIPRLRAVVQGGIRLRF